MPCYESISDILTNKMYQIILLPVKVTLQKSELFIISVDQEWIL